MVKMKHRLTIIKSDTICIPYYFDFVLHIWVEIDLCHGMTWREFYIRKIRCEVLDGKFGECYESR